MSKPLPPKKDLQRPKAPQLDKKWNGPRIVRGPYDPLPEALLLLTVLDCSNDPGLTVQEDAVEADVNFIMKKYMQTGVLPGVDIERVFADISDAVDYHEAQNIVAKANEQFMSLDASVRAKFQNDPAQFMNFVHDPKNIPELIKLGLATTPSQQSPIVAPNPAHEAKPAAEQPKAGS